MNLFQKLARPRLKIEDIKVIKNLFPKRMIYEKKLYKIKMFDRKYNIRSYTIKLINNKIEELYIDGYHPNAKINNGEFCTPKLLRQKDYSKIDKNVIENILTTFDIDDCYYTPWGEIIYEEM